MARDALNVHVYTFGGTPATEDLFHNAAAKFYSPLLDVKPTVIKRRTRGTILEGALNKNRDINVLEKEGIDINDQDKKDNAIQKLGLTTGAKIQKVVQKRRMVV